MAAEMSRKDKKKVRKVAKDMKKIQKKYPIKTDKMGKPTGAKLAEDAEDPAEIIKRMKDKARKEDAAAAAKK